MLTIVTENEMVKMLKGCQDSKRSGVLGTFDCLLLHSRQLSKQYICCMYIHLWRNKIFSFLSGQFLPWQLQFFPPVPFIHEFSLNMNSTSQYLLIIPKPLQHDPSQSQKKDIIDGCPRNPHYSFVE